MSTSNTSWICSVCGYIHNGNEPPDYCPVCGATSDLFEPYAEPAQAAAAAPSQWRCLNCEYIHDGDSPPEYCPVCGAPAERFESYTEAPAVTPALHEKMNIVVVGAGIAGVSAVESIRKMSPEAEITLVSKEPELPYYRLNLTRYLAGEITEEQLQLHPESWYRENAITLIRNAELCTINHEEKVLQFRGTGNLNYDKVILSIGSHPFIPSFPGANRENVTVLRTKRDADFILEQSSSETRCVVIGGGLLGLEAAGALAKRKVPVTLLEGHGWLLPRQLNEQAGRILEKYVADAGIILRKKARTKELLGDERVRGILLEDGETLPAELVIIATGVRSNSYIARLAGLDVNRGIVVNNKLQTGLQDIFAAGDVAEHHGVNYGTWGPSQFQGTIAGMNAAGGNAEFAGIPRSNMLKVLGYDMFSIGQIIAEDASYRTFENTIGDSHFFFMFRDNHMVGSILLGDTKLSAQVKNVVEKKVDCSELLSKEPQIKELLAFLEVKQ